MSRPPARSSGDGAWSLAQVAQAAGVSYQVARTASRLGHIDRTSLTWHDALVIRAVDELGGNPSSRTSDGQAPERIRAQSDRNHKVAAATRRALRHHYRRSIPRAGTASDLWLAVTGGSATPIDNLDGIATWISSADDTISILPLSRWVAALGSALADQPATGQPLPPASPEPSTVEGRREDTTSAPAAPNSTLSDIDPVLQAAAVSAAVTMTRTPAQQMAHWARIGRCVEDDPGWSARDVARLLDGRVQATVTFRPDSGLD